MVRRTRLVRMFFFMYFSTKLRRERKHDGRSFRDINELDKVYPYSLEEFNTETQRFAQSGSTRTKSVHCRSISF